MKSMPVLLACTAVGLYLAPGAALAGHAEFHLDTSAPAPKQLHVASRWLDVKLSPTSGNKLTIKADFTIDTSGSDEKAQSCADRNKVFVEQEGETLVVRQGRKNESDGCSMIGMLKTAGSIVIGVPAGIPLDLDSASGDITVTGDFGTAPLAVDLASGDLTVDGRVRSVDLETASGTARVTVSQPLERFKAEAASGDVSLKGGAADAQVSVASGDVTLEGLSGPASAEAASGDLSLSWDRFAPGSTLKARTSSGTVSISLPKGVSPGGRLETSSGDIKTDLPGRPGRSRHAFELTGSDGAIDVSTASGDIHIQTR